MDLIGNKIKSQVAKTPMTKENTIRIAVCREPLMKGLIEKAGDGKVWSK